MNDSDSREDPRAGLPGNGADQNEPSPDIEITFSEEKLKAYLSVYATGRGNEPDLTPAILKAHLAQSGISFGINEQALKDIAQRWNAERWESRNELIAQGQAPRRGDGLVINVTVNAVDDPAVYKKIMEMEHRHISAVKALGAYDVIREGETLITLSKSKDCASGRNVLNEEVEVVFNPGELPSAGENTVYDEKSKTYKAGGTGIAVYLDGVISIISVLFDGFASIHIDKDGMKATAQVYPPFKGHKPVTSQEIVDLVLDHGIKTGINREGIDKALRESAGSGKLTEFIAAEGTIPIPGEDAQIVHLIDFAQSLQPQEGEGGHVDFKKVSIIKSCEKGQNLARYVPPKHGTPGVNLFGDPIPALDGRDLKMPRGSNTEVSPDDPSLLVASVTGNARLNGNLIEVVECYVVPRDVDYRTGNINYPKTVIIRGDVKSGFNVDVGCDLEVTGIVEDCKIKAGGNVLVRAGFMGNGSGVMEVKGDVGLGYSRNQTVKCRKNIIIAGEAINNQLFARGNIEVGGKKIGIVGGTAAARREIICETAGSETGTKTNLEVGTDFALVEEKFKTDEKIKELSQSKAKIRNHLEKLSRIKRIKKTLPEKDLILIKKLLEMEKKINQQLGSLEDRQALIEEKLSEIGRARVLIRHTIYPGVCIKIGPNYLNINEMLIGPKSFVIKEGEIRPA